MTDALEDARQLLAGCLFIPADKIDPDATIASIQEVDSLTYESIVVALEDRVGREIDITELLALQTVRDVAHLLERSASDS